MSAVNTVTVVFPLPSTYTASLATLFLISLGVAVAVFKTSPRDAMESVVGEKKVRGEVGRFWAEEGSLWVSYRR